ncbi:MAG: serine protease [Patescibacteria group bacterium]|jgi:serine protease
MQRNIPSYISICFFTFLFSLIGNAQELTHVPGAFLVKPMPEVAIDNVLADIRTFSASSIQTTKVCTAPFTVWLIQTDAAIENEYEFLESIRRLRSVDLAQFNHFVSDRLVPDDPQFSTQWQYINLGNSGGTTNADFDADLAWDTTTGGLTESGDTIVICMVDEGLDISHPDLQGNLWFNHSEIPNNNIDDDENGYIDDYRGWNVGSLNDDLESGPNAGWHGTAVAGVMGARGNNGVGVTGINWDVKIMTVVRGATMDQTLAAYAYPFAFRKMYNDTDGTEGAFVVATNSSWGIDFGQPEEAPLWCAFYDSLGMVGILNSAATANGHYNVDQLGDLPTACSSDFLLSVTNIDQNNEKNASAAYGANSIDMGAYGTEIWTIKKNNSYGHFTGTSAASPSVAGAIALLYSAPCPDISWYAKHNPSATAQIIKHYLMNGTTPISALEDITVSEGRLNLKSSLDLLMNACAFTDCFAPVQISANGITETFATVSWLSASNVNSVNLRYKTDNAPSWNIINNVSTPITLTGLNDCTTYEYQLKSFCNNVESGFTNVQSFQTAGCCEPPSAIEVELTSNNTAIISWEGSTAIPSYNVRYRLEGALSWLTQSVPSPQITYNNLMSCSNYEIQIQANCNNTVTTFSESFFWQTSACDNCLEYNYCPVSISTDPLTWISYVQLNDLENSSGSGTNGYSDFTGNSAMLIPGFSYDLILHTDFDFLEYPLYFQIWIDLNQDGQFDNSEILLESLNPTTTCLIDLHIPATAIPGTTRMRIAGRTELGDPCGESTNIGEVEDYCVTIVENTACIPPQGVSGIPGENHTNISWLNNYSNQTFDIFYREENALTWNESSTAFHLIHLEDLKTCTTYEFKIRSNCDGENSDFSPIQSFTTLGCGPCLDLDYCIPEGASSNFEWIAKFTLNGNENESVGEGYTNFTNSNSTTLLKDHSYTFEINPGFAGTAYAEIYTIWIDFNQDGTFSDLSEKIFQTAVATSNPSITGSFQIPSYALEGATRLRIIMKDYSPPTTACESTAFFGEIEDYCISLVTDISATCNSPVGITATTISDSSVVINWSSVSDAASYQLRYRIPLEEWIVNTNQNDFSQLNHLEPCFDYEFQVRTICNNGLSSYSDMDYFSTDCLTGLSESERSEFQTAVFPNPFENNLQIRLNRNLDKDLKIRVFDVVGTLVKQFYNKPSPGQEVIQLNLESLANGIYFLELEGELFKLVKL